MRITERLAKGVGFSFEIFPPKTDAEKLRLRSALDDLIALRPSFVSVTYGAGGSTRDQTIELAGQIKQDTGLEPMAHLACFGHTVGEVQVLLERLRSANVENVLCLRGDVPREHGRLAESDFSYASDLLTFIRQTGWDATLAGACYPERHPESACVNTDTSNLKTKVDAGAEFLVTQLFFDNRYYFDLVRRARDIGITVPILPGILPITSPNHVERFAAFCGINVPSELKEEVLRHRDDPEAVYRIGVTHAAAQCRELLEGGAPGIHFFTLNRSRAMREILEAIDI